MPHMSQILVERAIGMLTAGMPTRGVARECNGHFSTISHLQCRFRELGSTANWPQPQTMCMVSCGRAVCWCECCEQIVPWWRWGYGMAGISYGQQTQLHFIDGNLNAQRKCDEMLRPIVLLFICRHDMFQHNNARPHVTRIYTQFLEAEIVPVLPWPAFSPCHPLSMYWMLLIDVYFSVF
jgi:hypothetical protein